jgi:hypothetical protein
MNKRKWSMSARLPTVDDIEIYDDNSDNRDVIASVHKTGDESYDLEVVYPVAKLMASAPELLKACKSLAHVLRWHFLPMVESMIGKPAAHAKDAEIEQALVLLETLGVSRESV